MPKVTTVDNLLKTLELSEAKHNFVISFNVLDSFAYSMTDDLNEIYSAVLE